MRWPDGLDIGIGLSCDWWIKRDIPTVGHTELLVIVIQKMDRIPFHSDVNKQTIS